MSLPLDQRGRPLQALRVSVTDRCNFRCRYCMPAETHGPGHRFLPRAELLSFEEIAQVVEAAVALGVRKVRLTGGEPLLRPNLPQLVRRLRALPALEELSLTTNGSLLASHAAALREAGLDRITVSLDALDPAVLTRLGGGARDAVLAGLGALEAAGFPAPKVNAVVVRGFNEDQILPLARHFRGTGVVLRFIEFMDVGGPLAWSRAEVVTRDEILAALRPLGALVPLAREPSAVAERFRWADGSGELGIIAAVTRPFCGDCTRLRLSADGTLFGCLFATGGVPLREALRAGQALSPLLEGFWRARRDRYSEERGARQSLVTLRPKVSMSTLGG